MKLMLSMFIALLVIGSAEARAERASVIVAKTTVAAVTAAVKAVPKAPKATWRSLKWIVAHV